MTFYSSRQQHTTAFHLLTAGLESVQLDWTGSPDDLEDNEDHVSGDDVDEAAMDIAEGVVSLPALRSLHLDGWVNGEEALEVVVRSVRVVSRRGVQARIDLMHCDWDYLRSLPLVSL